MRRLFCWIAVSIACLCCMACAAAVRKDEAALPLQADETAAVEIHAPEIMATATPLPTAAATPTPAPTLPPTPPPATETPVPDYYPTDTPKEDGLYKLVVFFGTQSVVAYRAEGGRWVEERIMICSTGKKTPTGTYAVHTKYRYHSLYGAKGQYCSRIINHILFHSVPIEETARKVEDGLKQMKLEEYEKLGTPASDGCVRLTCADAKWIYDNCDKTTVVIMTKENGPVPTRPPELREEEPYISSPGLGWDPTDPDERNPYTQTDEPAG